MIEADIREAPAAEAPPEASSVDLARARARAYLDLFERHVLRVALRWPLGDTPVTRKR